MSRYISCCNRSLPIGFLPSVVIIGLLIGFQTDGHAMDDLGAGVGVGVGQGLPLPEMVPHSAGQAGAANNSASSNRQITLAQSMQNDQAAPLLTLQDAYGRVVEENLDYAIMEERLTQTRAAAGKAWAAVLPMVQLQGSYRRMDPKTQFDLSSFQRMGTILEQVAVMICQSDPTNEICVPSSGGEGGDEEGGGFGFEPLQNTWTASLQVSVPIFDAAGLAGIKGAKQSLAGAEASIEAARREIMFGVAQAYYGTLMASEMVGIAQTTVEARKAHLEVAKALVEAGDQTRIAVLRAEIQVTESERDLEQALAGYKNARDALGNLLRIEGGFRVVRPELQSTLGEDQDELVKLAMENRRDVAAARSRVEAAQTTLDQSWYGYIPKITAQGSFSADNAARTRGADHPFSSVVQVVASVPLYQGSMEFRDREQKRSALREAELALQQLEEKIRTEISQSLTALHTSQVTAETSARQVELAQENRRLVLASFEAGMATPVDVVDADTGLYAAQVGALRDQLSRELSSLSLTRVVGQSPISP